MLEYLVGSGARRKLLEALWRDGVRGTTSSLARQAGVPFAQAYTELKAMARAQLASETPESGRLVYEANTRSPYAAALRQLVAPLRSRTRRKPATDKAWDAVRSELAAQGAPLWGGMAKGRAELPLEELLAKACELAHRDPSVAKVLPYVFLRRKHDLRFERLEHALAEHRQKHTGGLMLALAATLSGDKTLGAWAQRLKDKRRCKPHDFFDDAMSPRLRALAERNTPAVARAWAYRMNLTLDDFRSVLEKFPLADHLPS